MGIRQQGSVARVVGETGLTAVLAWLAWCGLWFVLLDAPGLVAVGLVPLLLWATPTLLIGLLVRDRPAGLRTLVAGGVAALWCVIPASWLVATSREQSGGVGWGLVLIGTVAAPVMALVLHGVVAAVLETVSDRSAGR